jgi:hypothetical protein
MWIQSLANCKSWVRRFEQISRSLEHSIRHEQRSSRRILHGLRARRDASRAFARLTARRVQQRKQPSKARSRAASCRKGGTILVTADVFASVVPRCFLAARRIRTTKPKAQAYFATLGWPGEILFDGKDITFAAGPYGVYRCDASVFNLLTK